MSKTKGIVPVLDFDGKAVWRCGECGVGIFHPEGTEADEDSMNAYRYCWHCGNPIQWGIRLGMARERKKLFALDHGLL